MVELFMEYPFAIVFALVYFGVGAILATYYARRNRELVTKNTVLIDYASDMKEVAKAAIATSDSILKDSRATGVRYTELGDSLVAFIQSKDDALAAVIEENNVLLGELQVTRTRMQEKERECALIKSELQALLDSANVKVPTHE